MKSTIWPYTQGAITLYTPKLNRVQCQANHVLPHHPVIIVTKRQLPNDFVNVMIITSQTHRIHGYKLYMPESYKISEEVHDVVVDCTRIHCVHIDDLGDVLGFVPGEFVKACLDGFAYDVGLTDVVPPYYANDERAMQYLNAVEPNIPKSSLHFVSGLQPLALDEIEVATPKAPRRDLDTGKQSGIHPRKEISNMATAFMKAAATSQMPVKDEVREATTPVESTVAEAPAPTPATRKRTHDDPFKIATLKMSPEAKFVQPEVGQLTMALTNFIKEKCTVKKNCSVARVRFCDAFRNWAAETYPNNLLMFSSSAMITRQLLRLMPDLRASGTVIISTGGHRFNVQKGIQLKHEASFESYDRLKKWLLKMKKVQDVSLSLTEDQRAVLTAYMLRNAKEGGDEGLESEPEPSDVISDDGSTSNDTSTEGTIMMDGHACAVTLDTPAPKVKGTISPAADPSNIKCWPLESSFGVFPLHNHLENLRKLPGRTPRHVKESDEMKALYANLTDQERYDMYMNRVNPATILECGKATDLSSATLLLNYTTNRVYEGKLRLITELEKMRLAPANMYGERVLYFRLLTNGDLSICGHDRKWYDESLAALQIDSRSTYLGELSAATAAFHS